MIYVPHENVLLVFGGRRSKNADGDLNDLWEFDIERHEWNEPNSDKNQEKGPHEIMTMSKVLQITKITNAFKVAPSSKGPRSENKSPSQDKELSSNNTLKQGSVVQSRNMNV